MRAPGMQTKSTVHSKIWLSASFKSDNFKGSWYSITVYWSVLCPCLLLYIAASYLAYFGISAHDAELCDDFVVLVKKANDASFSRTLWSLRNGWIFTLHGHKERGTHCNVIMSRPWIISFIVRKDRWLIRQKPWVWPQTKLPPHWFNRFQLNRALTFFSKEVMCEARGSGKSLGGHSFSTYA